MLLPRKFLNVHGSGIHTSLVWPWITRAIGGSIKMRAKSDMFRFVELDNCNWRETTNYTLLYRIRVAV